MQVEKQHYKFGRYVMPERWMSYYHQLKEVELSGAKKILYIGKGDGIVCSILKNNLNFDVDTFDFAEDLEPDILGDIREISVLCDQKYDCIVCCQILEHLPFECFENVLQQLRSICDVLIMSLPDRRFFVNNKFRFGGRLCIKFTVRIPRFYEKKFLFNGEHYWEIGTKETPLRTVERVIARVWNIEKKYNVYEMPAHRFYILSK